MGHDRREASHAAAQLLASQVARANAGVTVLARAAGVFRIVHVHGAQTLEPHGPVERGKHARQVVRDVVARVGHVAGVETHPQVTPELGAGALDALDDGGELLEVPADLAPLPGHGLEQNAGALALEHNLAERLGDELDAALDALPHMGARMEIVVGAREHLEAPQILGHSLERERPRALLRGARVVRIGRVRDERTHAMLVHERPKRRDVVEIERAH